MKLSGYATTKSLPDISKIEQISDGTKSPTKPTKNNRESVIGKLMRYVSFDPTSKRRSTHSGSPAQSPAENVTQIIAVDIQHDIRTIRLSKQSMKEQFGLYIRDGYRRKITEMSDDIRDRVPGVFVSRFVPGGLAESCGLLSVNDEILEINGMKVEGKALTEVYRLMVTHTQNMLLTIRTK